MPDLHESTLQMSELADVAVDETRRLLRCYAVWLL
jgi:hypothetical protein